MNSLTKEKRLSLLRLKCALLGCAGSPFCERCGTDLYDANYIQIGKLEPVLRLYARVYWATHKPRYCNAPMSDGSKCLLRTGHDGDCDDIPF